MSISKELRREIEARLLAAFGLMRVDAPRLAALRDPQFREWLAHDELHLALDELLVDAEGTDIILRRRFWEELAVAAMRMTLENQFFRITDRIPDLEPHVFGPQAAPYHVYCDFNGCLEDYAYSLDGVGTALDFARLRLVPGPSMNLILYEPDEDEDGTPIWLLANAVVVEQPPWGLVAKADRGSYRQEPR